MDSRAEENTVASAERRRALRLSFRREEAALLVDNCRRGALLAIIVTFASSSMDLFAYPELCVSFFLGRAFFAALMMVVLVLLYLPPMFKATRFLGHALGLLLTLNIVWMIALTEGGESPYYAGLNLIMVGSVLVMRWRISDGFYNALYVIASYWAVEAAINTPSDVVLRNSWFLVVTAAVAIVGLYVFNRLRFSEYCLREEVVAQQEKLTETHRKLQELDDTKTRFFANISHELRTPLTLILAPVEKLREVAAVRSDSRLKDMVDSLEDNGMRLLRLINDLLDLVRLDSGDMPLRPERFRPETFIDGLGRNLRPTAEKKGVKLSWTINGDREREVFLDRDRLEKIVLNLAVNALKFTPPTGRVELSVGIEGENLVLEVADTGAGMHEDQIKAAFERFWQADTSIHRKHRGVGIGLALVKSLTESLRGRIDIESSYGEGTRFLIDIPLPALPQGDEEPAKNLETGELDPLEELHNQARLQGVLPAVDEASHQPSPKEIMPGASGRERVVIAEDEDGLRRFLQDELQELGCEVFGARDGAEAWDLIMEAKPQLAILDFMMPEVDGITLTEQLRAHPETSQLPIILLTADADDTPRLKALEAGVSDFLTKPFPTTELRVRIRNLLDRQSYQHQLNSTNKELAATLEELRENEARLLQAEKLSSLGRMSAGIVHEVNNPLNYARAALHTLKVYTEDLPPSEQGDFAETLEDVEDGVNRVISIVSDLRSFTRGDSTHFSNVRIADVVESSRRLLSHELQNIDFEATIPEDIEVVGNENQLCQVVVNLVQNSAQSLKGSKRPAPCIEVRGEPSGDDEVCLRIRDNGCGISNEDLLHVFDPFFTRREVGEGMGLGLSICHRIIESHHGRIGVQSVMDDFTEFEIVLPRSRANEAAAGRRPKSTRLEPSTPTP